MGVLPVSQVASSKFSVRQAPWVAAGSLRPLKYFHEAPAGKSTTPEPCCVGAAACEPAATSPMRHFIAANVLAPRGLAYGAAWNVRAFSGKPWGLVDVTTGV